jgi:drug/metabolite transporter (DMT)-like permease
LARLRIHPALAFVVVAWGLNFSVIKLCYRDLSPAATGLLRYILMAPLLAAWCAAAGLRLAYRPGEFWPYNFAGFLGSGAYMVLFLEGMRLAPPAQAAIALATAPLWTTLFSVGLGQDRWTPALGLGSATAFLGVLTVVLGGVERQAHGHGAGVLLVFASAVVWAVSVVVYRPLLATDHPLRVLTLSLPGASVALLPYGWPALARTRLAEVSPLGWASLAYLVVVAGVLAFAAYYRGVADVGPSRSAMTQYFVPPTAAFGAYLVLGIPPAWTDLLGLLIVALGLWVASRSSQPTGGFKKSA